MTRNSAQVRSARRARNGSATVQAFSPAIRRRPLECSHQRGPCRSTLPNFPVRSCFASPMWVHCAKHRPLCPGPWPDRCRMAHPRPPARFLAHAAEHALPGLLSRQGPGDARGQQPEGARSGTRPARQEPRQPPHRRDQRPTAIRSPKPSSPKPSPSSTACCAMLTADERRTTYTVLKKILEAYWAELPLPAENYREPAP